MAHKTLFVLGILNFTFLFIAIYQSFAKAPLLPKIVFASNRDDNREIYMMNPDGTQQVNISRNKADDVSPKWSPTGEQILFASDRDRFLGSFDLYLMDADGSNVRPVFEKSADRRHPVWAPDGKQIAYTRIENGEWRIYIGTIDGKKEEQVAIGSSPTWSPNGTEIAYIGDALGAPRRIRLLKVLTKKLTFLPFPKVPEWVRAPAWSPKGQKIAFAWLREGFKAETIYTMKRDGTGVEQIIAAAGSGAREPAWSPRGDTLLYSQTDANVVTHIFKIALAGGKPIQLTHIGSGHHLGSWFDPEYALSVSPQPHLLTTMWGKIKEK